MVVRGKVHDELQGSQCLPLPKTREWRGSITANWGSVNGGGAMEMGEWRRHDKDHAHGANEAEKKRSDGDG